VWGPASGALNENPTLRAPAGKYVVTGDFTTLMSFSGPLDRALALVPTCSAQHKCFFRVESSGVSVTKWLRLRAEKCTRALY